MKNETKKRNVYFVQTGIDFGDAIYLPYGAGAIIANCLTYATITKEYVFQDIIYERKNISAVVEQIHNPYIVFFSCNIWNTEYNKCLANAVKKAFPDCYIAFGGHSVGNSTELMEQEKNIDFLNFGEGEPTVPDLLIHLLSGDLDKVRSIAFRKNSEIIKTVMRPVCDLNDYPSPYTMGVFDKIIQEHPNTDFSSILETNRGCPYHCAFCDWSDNRKIRFFSMERIKSEILWMAENKIEFCYGIDSNFGMFNRDLEITDFLVETNKKYGYPQVFRTNYEKNSTERVFKICNTFNSVGMDRGATVSYQTLCPEALKNIGRKNLTLEHFAELMRRYREAGIATYSELILGFPGETYETFCKGICTLLEQGQHSSLFVYMCELLPNAVMSDPNYIKKHQIRSMKVHFKTVHSKASSDNEVQEYSRLVRATSTMDEDAWVAASLFSTAVQCYHSLGLLRFFAIYLYYENIADYFTFYSRLNEHLLSSTGKLGECWRKIKEHFDDSLKGNWQYYDERFGDITWTYEEGAFLEALYNWDNTFKELMPFLESFGIEPTLFTDLLAFQKMIIRKPLDSDKEVVLDYDLCNYFEDIFEKNRANLTKQKVLFKITPKNMFSDYKSYARQVVWFGRRKEATMYHKDEYTSKAYKL